MSKSAAKLPQGDDPAALTRKRQYRLALALMIVGSALGWWAAASPWITVEESLLGAVTNADIAATWSVGSDLSGSEQIVSMSTVYPLAAILAGVLLAAGGSLAFARGAEWTVLGKSYERAGRTPRDAWESLDMGVDPTVDGE